MPYFHRNDTPLYYELHGSGPPLLLVAGLASDSQSWLSVLPALSECFQVILLDNRGVGRSCQVSPVSVGLMADDCRDLVVHLGFSKVNLLGHSMGGMVAMECACRYPHLIENLLLTATAPCNSPRNNLLFSDLAALRETDADPATWLRMLLYWIFPDSFFDSLSLVEEVIASFIDYPYPQSAMAFRRQVEALAAFDITKCLCRIKSSTCVIAGELDRLFPVSVAQALAEMIPGAHLAILPEAAHAVHIDQPDRFVSVVREFLSDPRPGTGAGCTE